MSPSAFHLHFKGMTALSPLQYQKRLRLQEARRLMLGEGLDAAEAAFRVGYDAPSGVASGPMAAQSALKLPHLFASERLSPSARERVPSGEEKRAAPLP